MSFEMEELTSTLIKNATETYFQTKKFSWHDYLFFVILLVLSSLIGVYFGFFQKKKSSGAEEYLLGNKQMGVFEISLSLISCTISGFTILALPADVYKFGIPYWLASWALIPVMIFSYFFVMPIFYKLKTPSTYEYLSTRFGLRIRQMTSILFTLMYLLFLPIILYIPALALAQGTGFNIHYITPFICGVCIFYTCVGGLKAVVWTDALQFAVMVGAVLVVTFIGTREQGGLTEVFSTAYKHDILSIDFDLDVTKRDTFWTCFLGSVLNWNYAVTFGQGFVQKCLALPSNKEVKKAYIAYALGIFAFMSISIYTGILVFVRYHTCDPYRSRKIEIHDEILPYYILDVAADIPGLPGVFIAGIFSASLSTLSASLNALSCTLYEDFIKPQIKKELDPKYVRYILQLIVVIVGVICTLLVFIVQNFTSVLEIAITVGSISTGPMVGVFALGMFIPSANAKGAFAGMASSLAIMSYIIFTSLYYKSQGDIQFPTKPVSLEDCVLPPNVTFRSPVPEPEWTPSFIYRISFYYYGFMGSFLVIFVGYLVSFFTKSEKDCVDKDLISPFMHWAIEKRDDIELANYKVTPEGKDLLAKD